MSAGPVGNPSGDPTPTTQLNVFDGGMVGPGFRASFGSEVNVNGGNVLDDFNADFGSVLNITGGSVGAFRAFGSLVNISGGILGEGLFPGGRGGGLFSANNSTVNISGGTLTVGAIFTSSEISISGGTLGGIGLSSNVSVVNISGGTINADVFQVFFNSEVNISGGSFDTVFDVAPGSKVNLLGNEFFLDGLPLDSLVVGEASEIAVRGGAVLSGTLADGTGFDFALNDAFFFGQDSFDPGALLTVTLVPEPACLLLLVLGAAPLTGCRAGCLGTASKTMPPAFSKKISS